MDTKKLEALAAAVEHGSFTRAAEALGYTQSGMTHMMNSLEREISTDKIGEMVMERLKPLDEVAYIRFASIYHRFQDAGSFMREISKFLEEK